MRMSAPEPVYILGAGMHPWGKWGNDFTEYGVVAARAALRDAGVDWRHVQLVAGADTIRNGYPASSPVPRSPRSSAGPVCRSAPATPRVPAVPKRCRVLARRSWPVSVTWRW